MAKKAESTANQGNSLTRYLRETRAELKKVVWPTRAEAWRLTAIVLAVTFLFALFLWAVDALFSNAIRFLIESLLGL